MSSSDDLRKILDKYGDLEPNWRTGLTEFNKYLEYPLYMRITWFGTL
jgi:hypothetical protein